MTEMVTCPKCGQSHEDWAYHFDDCPYVACDDRGCRAKHKPTTYTEAMEAMEHWRSHSRLGGCSHGR